MGWFTKKNKKWELRHLFWSFVSLIMFIPVPIHVYPIVMLNQARKSKVRSWYVIGLTALIFELFLFGSFILYFGSMSQGMLLTLGGSVVSYIVGNGILLNQAGPYLQRLELAEIRALDWIPSIRSQRKMELLEVAKMTPQLFVSALLYWEKEIQNRKIQESLEKVINLFQLIEKRDPYETDRFIVRHSTLVNVLKKYDELENSKLKNDITENSKKKLEKIVLKSALAIEQEVTNLFKVGILDISAESDAYLETLKSRNLLK